MLRKETQLFERRQELDPLLDRGAEIARLAGDRAWSSLVRLVDDPQVRLALLGRQPPGLALGSAIEPALPLALAVRLMPEELDPREGGRILDVLGRRADGSG